MSLLLLNPVNKRTQDNNDKLKIAKENSDMTILVYNKNGKNIEIQTVWKAYVTQRTITTCVPYEETKQCGVMMDDCDGGWVFVPTETEELANDYLKNFFEKKQLDLTGVDVVSHTYGNINKNTKVD